MQDLIQKLATLIKSDTLTPQERHIIEGVYELLTDANINSGKN